jgi:hypothetical protein
VFPFGDPNGGGGAPASGAPSGSIVFPYGGAVTESPWVGWTAAAGPPGRRLGDEPTSDGDDPFSGRPLVDR